MGREFHVFGVTFILSSCVFQPGSELNSAVPRGARGPRYRRKSDYT